MCLSLFHQAVSEGSGVSAVGGWAGPGFCHCWSHLYGTTDFKFLQQWDAPTTCFGDFVLLVPFPPLSSQPPLPQRGLPPAPPLAADLVLKAFDMNGSWSWEMGGLSCCVELKEVSPFSYLAHCPPHKYHLVVIR